jgi:hypothetical protein
MIDAAISHISNRLNQYLKHTFDLSEDVVVISNIVDQDGSIGAHTNDKLVVFLVNLEKDTVPYSQAGRAMGADRSVITQRPIYLNAYLMFAGCFSGKNYSEALKFISQTITFFQGNPVFDHQNSPELDRKLDKLILDMVNLDIQDLSSLWGVLSGKYLPSVLYKMRMINIDSGDVRELGTAIRQPDTSVGS